MVWSNAVDLAERKKFCLCQEASVFREHFEIGPFACGIVIIERHNNYVGTGLLAFSPTMAYLPASIMSLPPCRTPEQSLAGDCSGM